MSTSRAVVRVCRACGQRPASSFRSNTVAPSRAANLQNHSPLQSRPISTTPFRSTDTTHHVSPSDSSPPLPESMLPQSEQPSKPSPHETINPFPPLPRSGTFKITVGTVAHIHTNTAYIERNTLIWDKHLRKHYNTTAHDLVHDPTSLLRVGDVVKYSYFTPDEIATREKRQERIYDHLEGKGIDTGRGAKVTKKGFVVPEGKRLVMVGAKLEAINKKQRNTKGVRHVVREVISPFGNSIAERTRDIKKAGWLIEHEQDPRVLRQRVLAGHEKSAVQLKELLVGRKKQLEGVIEEEKAKLAAAGSQELLHTETLNAPIKFAGAIIGKEWATRDEIESMSGARIFSNQVRRLNEGVAYPGALPGRFRVFTVLGARENVDKALAVMREKMQDLEAQEGTEAVAV